MKIPVPEIWLPFIDEAMALGMTEPTAIIEHAHKRVLELCERFIVMRKDERDALVSHMSHDVWERCRIPF